MILSDILDLLRSSRKILRRKAFQNKRFASYILVIEFFILTSQNIRMNLSSKKTISYSLLKNVMMDGISAPFFALGNSVLSPVIMWKNINSKIENSKEFLHDRTIMDTVVKFVSNPFNSSLFSLYLAHFAFIIKLIMKNFILFIKD